MSACNADLGHPCDANDGEPCASCQAYHDEMMAEVGREWAAASPAERDPAGYRRDMVDGGRGHLLREDER